MLGHLRQAAFLSGEIWLVTHPFKVLLTVLHHAVVACFEGLHTLCVLEKGAISPHRELCLVLAEVVIAEKTRRLMILEAEGRCVCSRLVVVLVS